MKNSMERIGLILFGALYSYTQSSPHTSTDTALWLFFVQNLYLTLKALTLVSEKQNVRRTDAYMGVLYAISGGLALGVPSAGLVDFGAATLIRMTAVCFPLLWSHNLNRSTIYATIMSCASMLSLLLGATDTLQWPQIHWGTALCLCSALATATMGEMQHQTKWNPHSTHALVTYGTALCISALYLPTIHPTFSDLSWWVGVPTFAAQQWCVELVLKRHSVLHLTRLLILKKVLSVILATNWSSLKSVALYILAIVLGIGSLVKF